MCVGNEVTGINKFYRREIWLIGTFYVSFSYELRARKILNWFKLQGSEKPEVSLTAVKPTLRYQAPFRTVCARIALVFVSFMKNPINYTFFGSLIIPENDFIFKKRQKFNMFGKQEGFSTHTCLIRLGSTPSRNKENNSPKFDEKKGKCIFCGVLPVMRLWHLNVRWVLFWLIPERDQLFKTIELWQVKCNRSNLTRWAVESNLLAFNSPLLDVRKHSSFSFYLRNVFLISICISGNSENVLRIFLEMLTRLIKMPKIAAKSGEIIDATTSPVDKMNLDRSPPIHCPFFVKGFNFLHSWFGRRKHTQLFS